MKKMNLILEGWRKYLSEATLQRVTTKADPAQKDLKDMSTVVHQAKNGSLFLVSDSELQHVKDQHKKAGTGSVLHPSINIDSLVSQIANLNLKPDQVFYKIKVSNAGYRLVIDKQEAEQLKKTLQEKGIEFIEDTVKKPEAGGFIDVPRLNIKADLKNPIFNTFVTDLLDVLLPTVDFTKIYGATPQEKEMAMKHVKKVVASGTKYKRAFEQKKLHTFVTAFPTKEGFVVPKPSEWQGNFYIVYPAGQGSMQATNQNAQQVKENKMKITKQYLKRIIKEELNKTFSLKKEYLESEEDWDRLFTDEAARYFYLIETDNVDFIKNHVRDVRQRMHNLFVNKESPDYHSEVKAEELSEIFRNFLPEGGDFDFESAERKKEYEFSAENLSENFNRQKNKKITKQDLKLIIKEELQKVIKEYGDFEDREDDYSPTEAQPLKSLMIDVLNSLNDISQKKSMKFPEIDSLVFDKSVQKYMQDHSEDYQDEYDMEGFKDYSESIIYALEQAEKTAVVPAPEIGPKATKIDVQGKVFTDLINQVKQYVEGLKD
jgi:hypothetical protein